MSGVQKLMIGEKEILSVDYSDCKESEMMTLATELSELGIAENKQLYVLCIFNDKNFITPKVMRHMESVTKPANHLVEKMAIVGLNSTKKVILKGYNLLFQRNFRAFNTREEAIAYLVDVNEE